MKPRFLIFLFFLFVANAVFTADDPAQQSFDSAVALKQKRSFAKAYEEFARIKLRHPDTPLFPAVQFEMGMCSIYSGRFDRAMRDFQALINRFPSSDNAKDALRMNTLLYRLYVNPEQAKIFSIDTKFSSTLIPDLDEPAGLAIDKTGNIYLSDKDKKNVLQFDPQGKLLKTRTAITPAFISVDHKDQVYIANGVGILSFQGETISFTDPKSTKNELLEEIRSVAVNQEGFFFVSSDKRPGILVFDADRKLKSIPRLTDNPRDFAKVLINAQDQVFALGKERKQLVVYEPDGTALFTIGPSGKGYSLERIEDFAIDRANHIYIITKNSPGVLIFRPDGNLLKFITAGKRSALGFETPRFLDVDSSGAIFVLDKDQKRIIKLS